VSAAGSETDFRVDLDGDRGGEARSIMFRIRANQDTSVDEARAGVIVPETQTIRSAAGCHVNFFGNHAIRRAVIGVHRTRQRLYLMRDR
jgi:hypothetical protein